MIERHTKSALKAVAIVEADMRAPGTIEAVKADIGIDDLCLRRHRPFGLMHGAG